MKKFQFWKSVLVLFAAVGTVMPAPELLAADTRPVEVDSKEAVQKTLDVSLDADGVLNGYLVDGQGKALANEAVVIRQGRREVAKTKTDSKGKFEVKSLRGGVYQIESKVGSSNYRVWTNGTAPKNSRQVALVVNSKDPVVRGQLEGLGLGLGTGTALLFGAAAITLGVISINEQNDTQDQNDALRRQLDAIQNSL
jgi:hypothetical protein